MVRSKRSCAASLLALALVTASCSTGAKQTALRLGTAAAHASGKSDDYPVVIDEAEALADAMDEGYDPGWTEGLLALGLGFLGWRTFSKRRRASRTTPEQ